MFCAGTGAPFEVRTPPVKPTTGKLFMKFGLAGADLPVQRGFPSTDDLAANIAAPSWVQLDVSGEKKRQRDAYRKGDSSNREKRHRKGCRGRHEEAVILTSYVAGFIAVEVSCVDACIALRMTHQACASPYSGRTSTHPLFIQMHSLW